MLPDFGLAVYEQVQDTPFWLSAFDVKSVVIAKYDDRFSFSFSLHSGFISRDEDGGLPIMRSACAVTIEAFCDRPSSSKADAWVKGVLKTGERIRLQADKSLEYQTTGNLYAPKEHLIPCRLLSPSADYFKRSPQTRQDLEALERAKQKRLVKAAKRGFGT